MSMHCDQCDQGRRCTGACMKHYSDETHKSKDAIGLGCFAGILVMVIFLVLHLL